MKKLSVDTCVVLRLVSENNKFKERGYKKYEAYLYERKLEKDYMKKKIKGAMIKSFTPSKNSPIDNMVEEYIQYINKRFQKESKVLKDYEKGDFVAPNGYFVKKPTEEEYQRGKNFVDEVNESKYDEDFLNWLKEEYSKVSQIYQAGQLLLESLSGNVDLCITSSTLKEVENHIEEKTNGKTKGMLLLEEDVDRFLKEYITLIKIEDEKVLQIRDDVVEKLQIKSREDTSPMKKEFNSVDEYGDVQIMAEAILAGIPLVSFNLQDFICDKEESPWNERRRDNMIDIISLYKDKGFTFTLAYSPEEISKRCYYQSERESSLVKLEHIESESERFKDEYEMN